MRKAIHLVWATALVLSVVAAGCEDEGATSVKKITVSSDASDASSQDSSAGDSAAADSSAADTASDTAADVGLPDSTTGTADAADAVDGADIADAATQDTASVDTAGTDASDTVANCIGVKGCFSCPPKTNSELLNQCTGNSCAGFDNVKRLPLLGAGGKLPPLP